MSIEAHRTGVGTMDVSDLLPDDARHVGRTRTVRDAALGIACCLIALFVGVAGCVGVGLDLRDALADRRAYDEGAPTSATVTWTSGRGPRTPTLLPTYRAEVSGAEGRRLVEFSTPWRLPSSTVAATEVRYDARTRRTVPRFARAAFGPRIAYVGCVAGFVVLLAGYLFDVGRVRVRAALARRRLARDAQLVLVRGRPIDSLPGFVERPDAVVPTHWTGRLDLRPYAARYSVVALDPIGRRMCFVTADGYPFELDAVACARLRDDLVCDIEDWEAGA